jgi:hypothetical protein
VIWILFYYNSLPEMPKNCPLFSPEIMHRDFFMCNPTNTGHYKYPKFETLSYDEGCHFRELNHFLRRHDPDKFVIFYTRHTTLSGTKSNKVIGYFKVGRQYECPKGFNASESVLVPKNSAIEINYSARGVPVSWGNSTVKNKISNILFKLINETTNNIDNQYQQETIKIINKLCNPSGRQEIIIICNQCALKQDCRYWGNKPVEYQKNKLDSLYGDLQKCSTLC